MRVKLFTLRYSCTLGAFDETPLQEFARERELLGFREYFFVVNEVPHLTCVLTWQDGVVSETDLAAAREMRAQGQVAPDCLPIPPGPASRVRRKKARAKPDPTAGLDEGERLLFNSLREWRVGKAREEGVPPYVVFTNRHLVAIVQARPDSSNALGHVEGVGPGKVKRYGAEVLTLLGAQVERAEPAS